MSNMVFYTDISLFYFAVKFRVDYVHAELTEIFNLTSLAWL